jgi:hypothetical protein
MSRAAKIGTLVLAFVAAGALVAGVALSGAAAPGSGDALDRGQAALVGSNAIGGDAGGGDVAAQTTDGQVRGSPVLDLFLSQRTVSSGTESQVMVDILNTGEMDMGNDLDDRVTTARGLTLEVDDGDVPIEVGDGTTVVGDVRTDASPVQVPLDVTVPDDVPDGQYEVEVTAPLPVHLRGDPRVQQPQGLPRNRPLRRHDRRRRRRPVRDPRHRDGRAGRRER